MKTRSQILQELSDSLNSPAWSQLKNSLVGRELLSLGSEVIYRVALANQSFINSFDHTKCSYPDLITYGRRKGFAVSNHEPSYIKFPSISSSKPYASTSVGGCTFTSCTWLAPDAVGKWFQGAAEATSINNPFGITSSYTPSTFQVEDTTYYSLGANVLPESVQVWTKGSSDTFWHQMPIYDPMNSGSDTCAVVTLEDNTTGVYFSSSSRINLDGLVICFIRLSWADFTAPLDSSIEVYTGSSDSITYARNQVTLELLKTRTLASSSALRSYVTSNPGVLDCSIVSSASTHKVSIYIKPTSTTSVNDYSSIAYYLKLHGDIFADYKVQGGTPLNFQLVVTGATSDQQTEITNIAQELYNYDTLTYGAAINASDLSSRVFTDLGVRIETHIYASEELNSANQTLRFVPEPGSILTIDESHQPVLWDYDGLIMNLRNDSGAMNMENVLGVYGPSLIYYRHTTSSDYWGYYVFDTRTHTSVDITEQLCAIVESNISGGFTWINCSNAPAFMYAGKLYVLNDTSFWHAPSSHAPVISLAFSHTFAIGETVPESGAYYRNSAFNTLVQHSIYLNGIFYSFTENGGYTQLTRYWDGGTNIMAVGIGISPVGSYFVANSQIFYMNTTGLYQLKSEDSVNLALYQLDVPAFPSTDNWSKLFFHNVGFVAGHRGSLSGTFGFYMLKSITYVDGQLSYSVTDVSSTFSNPSESGGDYLKGVVAVGDESCAAWKQSLNSGDKQMRTFYQGDYVETPAAPLIAFAESTGTINYSTGEVSISKFSVGGSTLVYKSLKSAPLTSDKYFVLDPSTPIVWQ